MNGITGRQTSWTPERRHALSVAQKAAWERRRGSKGSTGGYGKELQRMLDYAFVFKACLDAMERRRQQFMNIVEAFKALDVERHAGIIELAATDADTIAVAINALTTVLDRHLAITGRER